MLASHVMHFSLKLWRLKFCSESKTSKSAKFFSIEQIRLYMVATKTCMYKCLLLITSIILWPVPKVLVFMKIFWGHSLCNLDLLVSYFKLLCDWIGEDLHGLHAHNSKTLFTTTRWLYTLTNILARYQC